MKKLQRVFSLLIAIAMIICLVGACSSNGGQPTGDNGGQSTGDAGGNSPSGETKTLTVGLLQESAGFDPAESQGSTIPMSLVYDTVVRRDANGDVQPCLATAWNWVDDTTVVLTIRDDVYFSNGDQLTPEDILYTFRHFTEGSATYASDTGYANIDFDSCTVDGYDLTIKLMEPDVLFIDRMANFRWSSVVSTKLADMTDEQIWSEPVGTGPYLCTANVSGSYATFVRNDNYWGDLPEAEEITLRFYSEENTMVIDFETGAIDMAVGISDNSAQRLEDGDKGQIVIKSAGDMIFFTMPEYVELFDDINARKAIAHALDADTLNSVACGILGTTASSTVPSTTTYYKNVGAYEYDPDLSRQLLSEAGYSDGDITFKIVYVKNDTNTKMCEAVQAMLADVGITLEVYGYDFSTAITYFMAGDLDFSLAEYSENCFDAAVAYSFGSEDCTNATMALTDQYFNNLLKQGLATLDDNERRKIYEEVQDYMYELCRWIPISEKMYAAAISDGLNVDSYVSFESSRPDLRYITFSS